MFLTEVRGRQFGRRSNQQRLSPSRKFILPSTSALAEVSNHQPCLHLVPLKQDVVTPTSLMDCISTKLPARAAALQFIRPNADQPVFNPATAVDRNLLAQLFPKFAELPFENAFFGAKLTTRIL
jgi:hypothetical protein